MMMQTRCAKCSTVFRVTPEQLKAKQGKVRCGNCQHVFNALDRLVEASLLESALAATDMAQTAADARSIPQALTERTIAEQTPALQDVAGPPAPVVGPVAPESIAASSSLQSQQVPEREKPAEPSWLAQDGDSWEGEEQPAGRAWPWALASVLGLLILLIQGLVQFRVETVVLMPASKPVLQALCGMLGCDLPLPQKASLLGIEASDLHPDPRHKGQLILNATLRNRAPFTQAYPDLELTLTDTSDQAVLRKVLAPAEYLPKRADGPGFAPNTDLALNLSLAIDGNAGSAAGYRLYLFYP